MKLIDRRNKLLHDMRQILDKADTEGRAMTSDEIATYDRMEAEASEIEQTMKRARLLDERGATVPVGAGNPGGEGNGKRGLRHLASYAEAFRQYVRGAAPSTEMDTERRTQVVGTAASGGYAVPEEWDTPLHTIIDNENVMRGPGMATIRPLAANKINVPLITARGAGGWTAESAAFTEADDTFSEVEISLYKGTRLVKLSEELLQDALYPVDTDLQQSLGVSLADLEEAAFVNGDGSSKPTGVVGGSTLGKTAAGAAAITGDELIDLYHALARRHRKRAKWMMADATFKLIRKLKDSNGQYLLVPGLREGETDTLLGKPVVISDNMPAATTGLKSVLFGDFSQYRIMQKPGIYVQRLNELYSANGHIGFRAFIRVGGKLVDTAAVKHLIQA
jgi:HK97 family phage major capsid protein